MWLGVILELIFQSWRLSAAAVLRHAVRQKRIVFTKQIASLLCHGLKVMFTWPFSYRSRIMQKSQGMWNIYSSLYASNSYTVSIHRRENAAKHIAIMTYLRRSSSNMRKERTLIQNFLLYTTIMIDSTFELFLFPVILSLKTKNYWNTIHWRAWKWKQYP